MEQTQEKLEMTQEEVSLAFLCLLGILRPPPELWNLKPEEWEALAQMLLKLQQERERSTLH